MSKGLEALKTLISHRKFGGIEAQWEREECRKTIEKELQALEIIRNKGIAVGYIRVTKSVEEYNEMFNWKNYTKEEYNLLKEVLL